MIGRSVNRAAHLLVSLIALGAVSVGFVTHPVSAVAAAPNTTTHVVVLQTRGTQMQILTASQTVGDLLKERGITPNRQDYVRPSFDTPLFDNIIIEYAPALPVTFITRQGTRNIRTTAYDVGALLEEQGVRLGRYDVVHPSLADLIVKNEIVRISHTVKWAVTEKQRVAQRTIHRIDFSLPPGRTKMLTRGSPGVKLTKIDFTQTDGKLRKRIVAHRVLRKPKPRIIAEGVGTYAAIAHFARHGLEKTSYIAAKVLNMVATAYTAGCNGCSGYTATGYRAGHGIVAVDPRVIPLGSKLYIPGYGFAIAGDTGGSIVGRRIDLGFDLTSDAIAFGRRTVKVYTLH